jgi:hypothetical protein
MRLSHLLLEDTLERRKDMLYEIPIIRRIRAYATKINKFLFNIPRNIILVHSHIAGEERAALKKYLYSSTFSEISAFNSV